MNKRKFFVMAIIMIAIVFLFSMNVYAGNVEDAESQVTSIKGMISNAETLVNESAAKITSIDGHINLDEGKGVLNRGYLVFKGDLTIDKPETHHAYIVIQNTSSEETYEIPVYYSEKYGWVSRVKIDDFNINGQFEIIDFYLYYQDGTNGEKKYTCHYAKDAVEENVIKMPNVVDFYITKPTIDFFEIKGSKTLTKDEPLEISAGYALVDFYFVNYFIRNTVTNEEYKFSSYKGGIKIYADNAEIKDIPDGSYCIEKIQAVNRTTSAYNYGWLVGWYWTNDVEKYGYDFSGNKVRVEGNLPSDRFFTIDRNKEQQNELSSFKLDKTEAKLNEKVFVDMITTRSVREATLIFNKDDGQENMIVTLTDTNEKPYFTVPFTVSAGTYNLSYLILKDNKGVETQYRSDEEYLSIKHFDFNSQLTIVDEYADTDILHLENEKITDSVVQKIKELDENVVVEIKADQDTTIKSELFESIKGTGKTLRIVYKNVEWLFNGKDITETKPIDVRVWVYGLYNDEMYNGAVKSGLRLEFANNGKLPGKCLIRVKNNSTVEQYLNGKKSYVYFYDENSDSFEKIAMQINCINGEYYEFYISHNSTYVMTTEEIPDEYIEKESTKSEDLALNGGEKKSLLPTMQLYSDNGELDINTIIKISIGIVCAIILIIVMSGTVFYKRKEKDKRD